MMETSKQLPNRQFCCNTEIIVINIITTFTLHIFSSLLVVREWFSFSKAQIPVLVSESHYTQDWVFQSCLESIFRKKENILMKISLVLSTRQNSMVMLMVLSTQYLYLVPYLHKWGKISREAENTESKLKVFHFFLALKQFFFLVV